MFPEQKNENRKAVHIDFDINLLSKIDETALKLGLSRVGFIRMAAAERSKNG